MNYLYLLLDLGSLSIPFIFSFHPKLKFYKKWKALFLAMAMTMLVFIPWDIIFTNNGFWGFNPQYFLDLSILGLPLEEWLFFICIPYACVFTHCALLVYFPDLVLSEKLTRSLTFLLIVTFILMVAFNYDRWYTFIDFSYAILLVSLVFYFNKGLLSNFYLTFLVMLIPFFLVNDVLTGSFIENEVVWYNEAENLNFRLFTIPVEDIVYAFTLLLTNLALTDYFQKKLFSK